MNQYLTPGYAREVQSVVDIQLEFDDPDEAFLAVQTALENKPGDEHLLEILHTLLKQITVVSGQQRSFYIRHVMILAKNLHEEHQDEQAQYILERAYGAGFYDRAVIDLMCAVYARLGLSDRARRLLNVHVDGVSLEPDSGTDADLVLESADPSNPSSIYEDQDTDSIDTIQ